MHNNLNAIKEDELGTMCRIDIVLMQYLLEKFMGGAHKAQICCSPAQCNLK